MLNLDLYIAFLPVMIAILMVPGPTLALIALTTARKGRRSGLQVVMGIACGKALLAAIVVGLLSTVLALVDAYGDWMRWFGAGFIVFIAIRAWKSHDLAADEVKTASHSHSGLFVQGFLVAITSPTTILFLATQFPLFIDTNLAAAPQLAVLGGTYLICALVVELSCIRLVLASMRSRNGESGFTLSPRGSAVCLVAVAALISPLGANLGL